MAATGLVGINPYGGGTALDISSKPVSYAIQHEQKEQAKREALDKYLMDYEKSINPAGMRKQEADQFMDQLAQAKQYYIENRDKILNPAKYGYDAQSNLMSHYKGMLNLVDQSKQAAAQDKAAAEHWYQAQNQGLGTPDGYLDAVKRSHLPVNHPEYAPIDPYQWNFYKKFDEGDFAKKVLANAKPSENIIEQKASNIPGYLIQTYESKLSPDQLGGIKSRAELLYDTNPGVKNQVDNIYKTGQFGDYQEEFNKLYPGQDIQKASPKQIAGALGLSLNEVGRTRQRQIEDKNYWMKKAQENKYNYFNFTNPYNQPVEAGTHIFDKIGSGGSPVIIGGDTKGHNYKINYGRVEDENGNPATLTKATISGENLPQDIYTILGESKLNKDDNYIIKSKDGQILSITPEGGSEITRDYADKEQKLYYGGKKGLKTPTGAPKAPNARSSSGVSWKQ